MPIFYGMWGHDALLLKGQHDLRGLPQSFNRSFVFLLMPAPMMDELMHVLVMDESPWLGLVTLILALLLGRLRPWP